MSAPSFDQLQRLAAVSEEAAIGRLGTTLAIDAHVVPMFEITVTSVDENELHSTGDTVITKFLIDGHGRTAASVRAECPPDSANAS